MRLYVANCIDRHAEPVIRVYSTKEAAIDYCKRFVEQNASYSEYIQESGVDGWLYHCEYSTEHDYVYVEETTLDNPEDE